MKYVFTTIMDRRGKDALAVDAVGGPGSSFPAPNIAIKQHFHISPPPAPGISTILLFASVSLIHLDTSCKWNYSVFVLLSLNYFT